MAAPQVREPQPPFPVRLEEGRRKRQELLYDTWQRRTVKEMERQDTLMRNTQRLQGESQPPRP